MLKITEHNADRLVLQDRDYTAGCFAGGFTLLSVFSSTLVITQGVDYLIIRAETLDPMRLIGLGMFFLVGAGLIMLGVLAFMNFARGTVCTLDKSAEIVTIRTAMMFGRRAITHSIYGISHLDVTTSDDLRAYGLFLVLRSGERIALAGVPAIDRDRMQAVIDEVRAFLRG